MLRIYFLQQWFNLSDPAVEEALYDKIPHPALGISNQPVDPATMSNRLADPDELAEKMSNGQS
jgi:IS5 family transposase